MKGPISYYCNCVAMDYHSRMVVCVVCMRVYVSEREQMIRDRMKRFSGG